MFLCYIDVIMKKRNIFMFNIKQIRSTFVLIFIFWGLTSFAQQRVICMSSPSWEEDFDKGILEVKENWNQVEGLSKSKKNVCEYKVSVSRGKLCLTLNKVYDTKENPYILLYNKNNMGFKYGRIELRAKCPNAKGIFPALWMRPTRGVNPAVAGEIDLMEWVSCFSKDEFQSNFHLWGNFNGKRNNHTLYPKRAKGVEVSKWHIYTVEWDKSKLIVRVDDQTVATWYAKDYPVWPFDVTYELAFDVAYGGWGATCGFDLSKLPQTMKVDWIRYYKLKEQ